MLRVCVIGMGHIGNLHAKIYKEIHKESGLAELVGVCDITEERARAAGELLGVPWYLDAQNRKQLITIMVAMMMI